MLRIPKKPTRELPVEISQQYPGKFKNVSVFLLMVLIDVLAQAEESDLALTCSIYAINCRISGNLCDHCLFCRGL